MKVSVKSLLTLKMLGRSAPPMRLAGTSSTQIPKSSTTTKDRPLNIVGTIEKARRGTGENKEKHSDFSAGDLREVETGKPQEDCRLLPVPSQKGTQYSL